MPERTKRLSDAIEVLFGVFARYPRPVDVTFCGFCYDAEEIANFRSTLLRDFDGEAARRFAWETADHWHNTETYKHFLPVILEALAPPGRCDDLYPAHLFETLTWHKFSTWPAAEREAIREYLAAAGEFLQDIDAEEWKAAAATLMGQANAGGA